MRCCCCSLKTGAIIIGLLVLINIMDLYTYEKDDSKREDIDEDVKAWLDWFDSVVDWFSVKATNDGMTANLIVTLIFGILEVFSASILLFGLCHYHPPPQWSLLPILVMILLSMVATIILYLAVFVLQPSSLVRLIIPIPLSVYFWACLFCYYQELRKGPHKLNYTGGIIHTRLGKQSTERADSELAQANMEMARANTALAKTNTDMVKINDEMKKLSLATKQGKSET